MSFYQSGEFTAASAAILRVFCIGGGGGGGYGHVGGGGGSGFLSSGEFIAEKNQKFIVQVGKAGTGSTLNQVGTAGGDSKFADYY